MASEPNEGKPFEPKGPVPDFEAALSNLANPELLSALDLALVELEERLYRYAHIVGPEVLVMADEGLVSGRQGREDRGAVGANHISAAQHTEGHLQIVGAGGWDPTSTRPAWNTDPRLSQKGDAWR